MKLVTLLKSLASDVSKTDLMVTNISVTDMFTDRYNFLKTFVPRTYEGGESTENRCKLHVVITKK